MGSMDRDREKAEAAAKAAKEATKPAAEGPKPTKAKDAIDGLKTSKKLSPR